jgi:hypothetical protein
MNEAVTIRRHERQVIATEFVLNGSLAEHHTSPMMIVGICSSRQSRGMDGFGREFHTRIVMGSGIEVSGAKNCVIPPISATFAPLTVGWVGVRAFAQALASTDAPEWEVTGERSNFT